MDSLRGISEGTSFSWHKVCTWPFAAGHTASCGVSYGFFMVPRVTRIGQPKGAKLEPSQATPGRHLRLGSIFCSVSTVAG